MIEKLEHTFIDYENGIGESIGLDDVINKLNEVIDYLNQLIALHKIEYNGK